MVNNINVYQRENYNVAIYCRLSNDDGENKESNSISNQRSILLDYVARRNWRLYDIYVDDGFTGTNFDRPAFKRLLKDIEEGNISVIVTKDMSRLGRDYIQVGYYIERYFPEQGVRYIAVNDNIDTGKDINGDDITPFKAVINDMYSKDISRKIRSVFDLKRREGKFIGAFAPYGYKKDPKDKGHLIIDDETAPIVRRIFDMYLSGEGYTSIARMLNSEGISPPAINKERRFENYSNGRIKVPKWSHSGVKHILTNATYTGNLAQGKSRKINYKSSKIKRLKSNEWVIIKDTHPPIISEEKFNLARGLMKQKKVNYGAAKKQRGLFSGLVFCGDCKQYMTYYKMPKGYYFLICSTYKNYGKDECTRHSILEKELIEIITKDFHDIICNFDKDKLRRLCKAIIENDKSERNNYNDELLMIEKRLNEVKRPLKLLYEDKVKGLIDEEKFRELYDDFIQEENNLKKRKNELEIKSRDIISQEERIDNILYRFLNLNKLSPLILNELIKKIEVYEDQTVKIYYKIYS